MAELCVSSRSSNPAGPDLSNNKRFWIVDISSVRMIEVTAETAKKEATTERILSSASSLFAQNGYKGVSTREIAEAADVNEITIYRHYPRKRDLYLAVLDAELGKISLKGDFLSSIATAPDTGSLLRRTFQAIESSFAHKPEIVRLLHHIALDLDSDLELLLRRHLSDLIDVIALYVDQWAGGGSFLAGKSKPLVLAMIAIALNQSFLMHVFSADLGNKQCITDAWVSLIYPKTDVLLESN
jgi:AcrR family transcriptional regulator